VAIHLPIRFTTPIEAGIARVQACPNGLGLGLGEGAAGGGGGDAGWPGRRSVLDGDSGAAGGGIGFPLE
jgi:hypothetical protein